MNAIKIEYPAESPISSIRVLCPTRWTVRASAIKAVIDNYAFLLRLWDECKTSDPESKAKIIGIKKVMADFDFIFGLHLGNNIVMLIVMPIIILFCGMLYDMYMHVNLL